MRIAILDDYCDTVRSLDCFRLIRHHEVEVWTDHTQDDDVLQQRLANVEALVLIRERTSIRRSLIERLPKLRLISLRSSFGHIDIDACTERGILVCSNLHAGTPSYAAAELTWALVLAACRQIPRQSAALRLGTWQVGVGTTLHGNVLGIFRFGRIGAVVASYGRAFGMHVLVWSTPSSLERARAAGYPIATSKSDLFERSDVLSVHLRLVDATRAIISRDDLMRMKSTALFVNTSRAGLVAAGALEDALQQGHPGRAAVDVYESEPVHDPDVALLQSPNALCTPHIGFVTREEFELQFADVFAQIVAFEQGMPIHGVNGPRPR